MDNMDLFSHPVGAESAASGEASAKPVEYPTFSDQPGTETPGSAPHR